MPIVIRVSTQQVQVPKYDLECPFISPSPKLSQTVLETLGYLRQSISLQLDASRENRGEVIRLLRSYGLSLYQAIIPPQLQPRLTHEGVIYILPMDKASEKLPWELLYDGNSFFSLTQGVCRLSEVQLENLPVVPSEESTKENIRISLNSYSSYTLSDEHRINNTEEALSSKFVLPIEELLLGNYEFLSYAESEVNSSTGKKSLLRSIAKGPSLFLFSGFSSQNSWLVEENLFGNQSELDFKEFREVLPLGVSNGLRAFLLYTSSSISPDQTTILKQLQQFFQLGLPLALSIHGKVARTRVKRYFQNLLLHLVKGEYFFTAHRHALNSIENSFPLSWDWSWIQLRLNTAYLMEEANNPVRPFPISRLSKCPTPPKVLPRFSMLNYRKFSGSQFVVQDLIQKLYHTESAKLICFQSSIGIPQETYVQEFFRRFPSEKPFTLEALYYHRWGFSGKEKQLINESPLIEVLDLFQQQETFPHFFEESLISLLNEENPQDHFLLVFSPPTHKDSAFQQWIRSKQKEGHNIIFLSGSTSTLWSMPTLTISIDQISKEELVNSFGDQFPVEWKEIIYSQTSIPDHFKNWVLLKMIARLNKPEKLIQLCCKNGNLQVLWKEAFQELHRQITTNALNSLAVLYLLQIKCNYEILLEVLNEKDLHKELFDLRRLNLIETNLHEDSFWVPLNIIEVISKYALLSRDLLIKLGKRTLIQFIEILDNQEQASPSIFAGFHYCLKQVALLGEVEVGTHWNLLHGKKLARKTPIPQTLLLESMRTGVELALLSKDEKILINTLVIYLDFLELINLDHQTEKIYQWLLTSLEKQQKWDLLARIQVKFAKLNAKLGQKDKAVVLVTSSILLNSDLNNYANRYQNLIATATLLLELEEFEKVSSLLQNADFDLKLLNRENLAKLWLIDGHLLYQQKEYSAARNSLEKGLKNLLPQHSIFLWTNSLCYLVKMYCEEKEIKKAAENLNQLAKYYEQEGDVDKMVHYHQRLWELYGQSGQEKQAIYHLQKLFRQAQEKGDNRKIQTWAHHLGKAYYQLGEQEKSTHYYKMANEFPP